MYSYDASTAPRFLSGELPGNVSVTGVETVSCEAVERTGEDASNYTYDQRFVSCQIYLC